jgi:hypothetical protein
MAGKTTIRTWLGISLSLLWLGVGGGCHCMDECGLTYPHMPGAAGKCCAPQGTAMMCGPCYGYRPTCWMPWSEYCCPCPPPEHISPVPSAPAEQKLMEGDLVPPKPEREIVPRPKSESRKLEPPKKKSPPPIPPPAGFSFLFGNHRSKNADWGVAPLPDDILPALIAKNRQMQLHACNVALR